MGRKHSCFHGQLGMRDRSNGEQPSSHSPRLSMTSHARTSTTDIRKRMNDVYNEMEQNSRAGRLRMPLKFVNFHETDVLYQFTRAAVGYTLAYVKVKSLEKEGTERASAEELAKIHASQMHNQFHHELSELELQKNQQAEREVWQQRLRVAVQSQGDCATLLAETYARLVLHCSNFERHKEDERFFESVYFFVCAVVKVGLAPEHWPSVENELGFVFRGAQFNSTVKLHTSTKLQREQAAAAAAAASAASEASNTAAKKIQNLSAASSAAKDNLSLSNEASRFEMPTAPSTRCCFFPATLPVSKIVSELEAAKLRASRNVEVSQSIRDRIRSSRDEEQQRRQLDALVSPRNGVRIEASRSEDSELGGLMKTPLTPQQPRRRPLQAAIVGSPRVSMKATFTSRSPAVNHLLPGTEDRVRLALEEYERSFQLRLRQKRLRPATGKQLEVSPTRSDLSSCSSAISTLLPAPRR